jgi:hypothetical protein
MQAALQNLQFTGKSDGHSGSVPITVQGTAINRGGWGCADLVAALLLNCQQPDHRVFNLPAALANAELDHQSSK